MNPLLFRRLRLPRPLNFRNFRGQLTAREKCQLSHPLWRRPVFPYLEAQVVLDRQVARSVKFDRPQRVCRKRRLRSRSLRAQREAPQTSMKAQKRRKDDWRGRSESGSYRVRSPPENLPSRGMMLRRTMEILLLLTRNSKYCNLVNRKNGCTICL